MFQRPTFLYISMTKGLVFRFRTSLDNVCQNLLQKFDNYWLTTDHYVAFSSCPYLVGVIWCPVHVKHDDSEIFPSHFFHFWPRKHFIGRGYPAVEVFQSVPPKLMNVWFHMEKRLDLMPFSAFVF